MNYTADYRVLVNGNAVQVYRTPVHFEDDRLDKERNEPEIASFCYFPITNQPIEVEVLFGTPTEVKIRPTKHGITVHTQGRSVRFRLDAPAKLSFEIDGLLHRNLMIFAERPEQEPLTEDHASMNEDILYFGPGVHEVGGTSGILELKSGQTLYMASGAIVRGRVFADGARNIAIRGAGILEGTYLKGRWPEYLQVLFGEEPGTPRPPFVDLRNCRNVRIEGVKIIDSPSWTVCLTRCEQVRIEDIKLIGYVPNSDGINPVESRDVTIKDVFVRTGDDCIAIKANQGNADCVVERIEIRDSVFWADGASAIEIGHETTAAVIQNVVFENIDILHQNLEITGYHAIDIANCDQSTVRRIVYRDIRVEHAKRLIGLRINGGIYSQSSQRGRIEDIVFENIVCGHDAPFDIHLYGYDEEHLVENVDFRGLKHLADPGRKPDIYLNPFVRDIKMGSDERLEAPFSNNIHPITPAVRCHEMIVEGICFTCPSISSAELISGIPFEATIVKEPLILSFDVFAKHLFFLHTVVNLEARIGDRVGEYIVSYENGENATVPILARLHVDDWRLWSMAGWQAVREDIRVYVHSWCNPMPEQPIRSIQLNQRLAGQNLIWLGAAYGQ